MNTRTMGDFKESDMLDNRGVTQLAVGSLADSGISRDHQEDSLGYISLFETQDSWSLARRKGNLYIVADGVGGRESGEVASQLAVNVVLDEFYRDESPDIARSLLRAIQIANTRVVHESQVRGRPGQMRTTIVCAVIRGQEVLIAHAGDSRAYLVRGGQAEPLTEDHTLVNQWVREGILSSQQAKDHHQSHVITQSIGNPEGVELESRWEEIRPGDVIVLCSDGLHGIVSDQEIAQTVSYIDNSQRICEALVDMANDKGGPDNISIITIQIEQVMPEPEPATFPSIPLPTGFGVRSNDEGVPIPQVHTPQLPQGRVHKSLSARTPSMRSIRKKKQTDTAKRKALRPRKERPIILWASALIPVALALGTILGVILSQAFSSDTTDLALRQQVDALRTQVATLQSLDSPTPSAITGVHTPTAALTQTITSTLPKTQITGVMKITTWLYDRPDYTASTTVQAHSDQQVTVLGRTEEKIRDVFWVLVLLDDERQGWIDANVTVIELPVPPKDLPIATPPLP